jgi:DNA-binding winged helix-turn-helix (wHTH) protein/tetratricopeptide (TPR) repeat protein
MNGSPSLIRFPPYELDLRTGQLRRAGTAVALRPKTFAVLQHLAERPGELVSKRALLDAVWGDVAVSEDVVRISAGELRAALGDERMSPRYIETVHRRGYRFVAPIAPAATAERPRPEPMPDDRSAGHVMVGRARERDQLASWIAAAADGRRQIGFVTGEAGIGKTTLVDMALGALAGTQAGFAVGRGQCIEHYGGGAAYLPVLAALASLAAGPERTRVEAVLRDQAPRWLLGAIGFPAAGEAAPDNTTLQRLAAILETLAAAAPLVLVLEDVQWSDYSTLDLLSVLAHRGTPSRLLVLCTLRPADAIAHAHPVMPVKRELLRKALAREIPLGGLSTADVAGYLAARFDGEPLPDDLLSLVVDRSEGNPFFVVTMVDHLLEHALLVRQGEQWRLRGPFEALRTMIPDGIHAVVEPRLERLDENELSVLEAASVAGPEFAAHAIGIAAQPGRDVEAVERICDSLVRRQEILCARGESRWPDKAASARYAFRHAIYRQVIYSRLGSAARQRLHQVIGERLELAYAGRTDEVASELAAHFERSRDLERAIRYHADAAARARQLFSYAEARLHLEAALDLMGVQPETADGLRRQIPLLDHLGWTSFALGGWGDEAGARAFARLREIAERFQADRARFQAMEGELVAHVMRAEYAAARTDVDTMLRLGEQLGDRTAIAGALPILGATLVHVGELEAAHDIAERGIALSDPDAPTFQAVSCWNLLASTCAHRGLIAEARAANREAVALAAKLDFPYVRAHAANFAASVCGVIGDVSDMRAHAADTLRLADECGFSVLRITASLFLGWCDVSDGQFDRGLDAVRGALADYAASGQRISTTSYSLMLVEAHLARGDTASAIRALDDTLAFAAESGESIYEHEIHRLRGECLVRHAAGRATIRAAVGCFERAMAIASERKALLYELRAATSLHRVDPSAHGRLGSLLERFRAEDDCTHVRRARASFAADQGDNKRTPTLS